ncbi:phosphate ABC transporter permease subunit PstC [Oceaniglobus ichthyenteri]|uniref:phosphate ABC transporter permease subunit PstC n=1 Tax=Oceaniglobus ichthyenteri TaxID=2136177 RepID=UPI000D38FB02|nr:phosphate ABC transporter permease subunit PstC [Oceaniglobus ichthyenteri]
MPLIWIFASLLALGAVGYAMGRRRAVAVAGGDARRLHSLPNYYGLNVLLAVLVPSFGVLFAWMLMQPMLIEHSVAAGLPAVTAEHTLVMSDVRRLAEGLKTAIAQGAMSGDDMRALATGDGTIRAALAAVGVALGSEVEPVVLIAAQSYLAKTQTGDVLRTIVVITLAVAGFYWAMGQTNTAFRARNTVERAVLVMLMAAASIAILTTVGIVFSMLFETINFFGQYQIADFFFSTTWSPNFRGNSQLGILPLLWGTLYISIIALLVAVPIGLYAAIYLSEYAAAKTRAIAKPLIEVLAGIPTIVYGLFALVTVGPLLRDYFAQPMGWGESGSSVMTAGLVMGIMLIPFVSSLSDDIINAVPQTLRDGSFGLGATKSETIRQVVLPAALPGIVGAVLLAASRAIGETMIVVLGAGAAARMDLNPFEAMTTVTVKIVSQLTGDTDFAAPETLVAFALGLTLFAITLVLNVIALIIVRTYREHYE